MTDAEILSAYKSDVAALKAQLQQERDARLKLHHELNATQKERDTQAWLFGRLEEEIKLAGMEVQWTDGGGSKCPTGWHRNPYINAGNVVAHAAQVEKERDEAVAALAVANKYIAGFQDERDEAAAKIATAQAVMAEQAARLLDECTIDAGPYNQEANLCRALAKQIRAIAPLPASLRVVEAEKWEQVEAALLGLVDSFDYGYLDNGIGGATVTGRAWLNARAALALMTTVETP